MSAHILFLGDNHGNFDHIAPAIVSENDAGRPVDAVIFLGDIEAKRSFENEIAPILALGVEVYWIQGNHDTDTEENWRNLQESMHRNIGGRVVDIAGTRVAGLGGIFRGFLYPRNSKNMDAVTEPRFDSYDDFSHDLHQRQRLQRRLSKMDRIQMEAIPDRISKLVDPTKNGQLRKHQSSIFPNTIQKLSALRADILVTHEEPGSHPYGFEELDLLAMELRVKCSFHGHQHDNLNYSSHFTKLGYRPFGVGFCGITDETGRGVLPGDFDAVRSHRQKKLWGNGNAD